MIFKCIIYGSIIFLCVLGLIIVVGINVESKQQDRFCQSKGFSKATDTHQSSCCFNLKKIECDHKKIYSVTEWYDLDKWGERNQTSKYYIEVIDNCKCS